MWYLDININKTKTIIFNESGKLLNYNFNFDGKSVENVHTYKYLGVLFSASGTSNFCINVFMLLFSLSIVSDRRSLKIENKNNSTKTLTAEAPYIGLESLAGWNYL